MKIYWYEGKKNAIGCNVLRFRKEAKLTQKELSERLQLAGYDFDRLTIGRIESGNRFVADYEVKALADALHVRIEMLYE